MLTEMMQLALPTAWNVRRPKVNESAGCQWTHYTVNSSQVTSSLSHFLTFVTSLPCDDSPCDDFTVMSYTTDVYSTLHKLSVSVSCCCVLMAYMRKPILGW